MPTTSQQQSKDTKQETVKVTNVVIPMGYLHAGKALMLKLQEGGKDTKLKAAKGK